HNLSQSLCGVSIFYLRSGHSISLLLCPASSNGHSSEVPGHGTMPLLHPPLPDDLVTFDVRGRVFRTTLTTLRRFPESVLYKMVQYEQRRNRSTSESASGDAFFVDRDPDLFAEILRFHDTDK